MHTLVFYLELLLHQSTIPIQGLYQDFILLKTLLKLLNALVLVANEPLVRFYLTAIGFNFLNFVLWNLQLLL